MKQLSFLLATFFLSVVFNVSQPDTALAQCSCSGPNCYTGVIILTSSIGGSFSGNPIYIDGILEVDNSFSISGKTIYFTSTSGITIDASKTLTISSSSLLTINTGCSTLWRGISNHGTLSLTSSTVELALDALTCYNNSTYTITDATFNKNYEGIVFSGISGTYSGTCTGTHFQCLNSTTPVALGYSPYSSVRSHVGIDASGVSLVNIGSAGSNANVFDNLDYGIYSSSTGGGIDADQNEYYRCNVVSISGVTHPAAVHMENSSGTIYPLTVTTSIIGSSSTVDGIHRGIDIDGKFNVTINGGHLTYIEKYGIIMTDNSPTTTTATTTSIDHLTIDNFGTAAIYFHDNPGVSNSIRSLQDISYLAVTNGGNGAGIIDLESAYPNYVELHAHDMPSGSGYFLDDLNTGIRLQRLKQFTGTGIIHDCWITDVANIGIQLTNCVAPIINSNTIASANGTSTGIYSDNTAGAYLGLNDISDHENGFYGTGDLSSTDMVCNTFTNCNYGIQFDDVSNFGPVGAAGSPSDNQWFNIGTWGIFSNSTPTTLGNLFAWYVIDNNQTNCPHSPALTSVYTSTHGNSPSTAVNLPMWKTCGPSACGLYSKLDSTGELLHDRTVLLNNIVFNTGIYATLNSFQKYMENAFAYSILNGDTNYLHLGTDEDAKYQQFYDSLQQTNIGAFNQLGIVAQSGDTVTAREFFNSITPDNDREIYLKQLFEIYDRTLAVDTAAFSSEDSALMLDIAYMDPNVAGDAPFMAQGMLGIVVIRNSERMEHHYDSQSMENVQIFPNPAEDFTQVQINNFKDGEYKFRIFDLRGVLLNQYSLSSPYSKISLDHLLLGSYLYSLSSNEKIISRGKLIKL